MGLAGERPRLEPLPSGGNTGTAGFECGGVSSSCFSLLLLDLGGVAGGVSRRITFSGKALSMFRFSDGAHSGLQDNAVCEVAVEYVMVCVNCMGSGGQQHLPRVC